MRPRYDVLSIFPEYLQPLELSLIGKARKSGLLSLTVTDLRDFTTDRHRTVDDTPYGGGAGMVMKPEPWAQALESVLEARGDADVVDEPPAEGEERHDSRPLLVVPSPAGNVFTQRTAEAFAQERHIVFACGRYEGIDERVLDWAGERFRVMPVSLGDYVLNGGEVAVMAMVEATARLLPGVIGNPESLVEESHSDGLLEYPVYTKPAVWRDRAVPDVLLSGNHAVIARARRDWQIERTARRRPDLIEALDESDLNARDRSVLDAARSEGDEGNIE
ncbi:tRNA (guanosine(37)-N1)-methyltransferase TrmD [Kocuria koreensis]|jgi:tRNA (guanine37-N1)-methyltransferase|uniref:tRNA (guanine-N(1)-)-methyltransferase n=1 Tax=Rothia koreensis TaxID=592378 RepID=A0A7K1LGU8_9MICC|nr:tRNA (guanosine(37)-N1)-methyltransferase TrmD [Rothia koreensis]MUN54162.1 tRNA (guanosine(37)-N1)-methyltransferase TrmD [Rothia koreensis]